MCKLVECIDRFLKFNIFHYFIKPYTYPHYGFDSCIFFYAVSYANYNCDITNLMISCKSIHNSLLNTYMQYSVFNKNKFEKLNPTKYCLVRNMSLADSEDLNRVALPTGLTELSLGYYFNAPLHDNKSKPILPTGLTKLIFGVEFNQKLFPGDLPSSLIDIQFNVSNCHKLQIVPNVIPPNVKKLRLGWDYNEPFITAVGKKILPENLVELTLTDKYTHSFLLPNGQRILPMSLKKLVFEISNMYNYNVKISKLRELNFGQDLIICYSESSHSNETYSHRKQKWKFSHQENERAGYAIWSRCEEDN